MIGALAVLAFGAGSVTGRLMSDTGKAKPPSSTTSIQPNGATADRTSTVRQATAGATTTTGAVESTGDLTTTAARATTSGASRVAPTQPPWLDRAFLDTLVARIAPNSDVGVAVRGIGDDRIFTSGARLEAAAWSTLKVPLIMTRLRIADAEHADVNSMADIHAAAYAAITVSDNDAARRIFAAIELRKGFIAASRAIEKELSDGGSPGITVATAPPPKGAVSTWGQTTWPLASGTEFFRNLALHCVPPAQHVNEVLNLMSQVVLGQRWGIGSVKWVGSSYVGYKGGWGPLPAPGYLVRQFGIVRTPDGRGVVIGLITYADSYGSGAHVLDELASAVAQSVRLVRTPVAKDC